MDNRQRKKAAEYEVLKAWLMLDSELPKGKIIENESPDFLYFTSKMKAVGIEITSLKIHSQDLDSLIGRKNFGDLYMMKLQELITKKNSLQSLYRRNPQITKLWLLIVSDGLVYDKVHRLLPSMQLEDDNGTFSKIELFFHGLNKAFSLK
ncbi:MAG TPA: hypothetical protein PKE03_01835 [Bacteroidales bacterium]|nr:hypothetical protein [Bacteroidales bacterium]